MDKARSENTVFDTKATFKELSFHIGGHLLHSLFWKNLAPAGNDGGGEPTGTIATVINEEYGSFERFKKIFSQTTISTEGSGWAALTFCMGTKRPIIMQVEKHNTNIYPMLRIRMVLDVWEHAYYLDYKNDRGKFVAVFFPGYKATVFAKLDKLRMECWLLCQKKKYLRVNKRKKLAK